MNIVKLLVKSDLVIRLPKIQKHKHQLDCQICLWDFFLSDDLKKIPFLRIQSDRSPSYLVVLTCYYIELLWHENIAKPVCGIVYS